MTTLIFEHEGCPAEVWSWDHFSPNAVDGYWIRCTLAYPHTEHEDGHTGLRWRGVTP